MINNLANSIITILKDESVQKYAIASAVDLAKAVKLQDPGAFVDVAKNMKELVFHVPTVLFWDKMKRFLCGTFLCYEDQLKLAARFDKPCNDEYEKFTKKLISVIDSIVEDEKIDYLANLTRCFLLCGIDKVLYFKLVQLIKNCTVDELEYIRQRDIKTESKNTLMVSVLSLQGLFIQKQDSSGVTWYVLSDIGIQLKECSLNFDEDRPKDIKKNYEDLEPLPQAEPMSESDLDDIIG